LDHIESKNQSNYVVVKIAVRVY